MKSFVDNFNDKRISIETLNEMFLVEYQRTIFLDMLLENYTDDFEITIENKHTLKLVNDDVCVFVLISSNKKIIDKIRPQIKYYNLDKRIYNVVFNEKKLNINLMNVHHINPKDWMNNIISNGINRKILHLQFMRDLEFDSE